MRCNNSRELEYIRDIINLVLTLHYIKITKSIVGYAIVVNIVAEVRNAVRVVVVVEEIRTIDAGVRRI